MSCSASDPLPVPTPPLAEALRFDADAGAQMERFITDLGRMYRERNEALREATLAQHDALFRLALAAEFRDGDTGVHIVRLGFLAEALALGIGQPADWSAELRLAAPMHDIGKIGVPDVVLKKQGPLDAEQRAVMNGHARIGAQILGQSRIPLFRLSAEIALTHHERWDGSGYPAGLAGEGIPLSGRIVAVVDFFDALTMDRCYRPAFSDAQALEMLARQRGQAFDPALVDAFLAGADGLLALRDRVDRVRPSYADLVLGAEALNRPHARPAEPSTP